MDVALDPEPPLPFLPELDDDLRLHFSEAPAIFTESWYPCRIKSRPLLKMTCLRFFECNLQAKRVNSDVF
jgi:hypothetical protein